MKVIRALTIFTLLSFSSESLSQAFIDEELQETQDAPPHFNYSYNDRAHSFEESSKLILYVYGATWASYPLTQWNVVKNHGSWSKYKSHFGKLVFDQDEPFWNWMIHPLSGSQLFLLYRSQGYSRINSLAMSIISSSLFEFTVEVYTEPASLQDLYQTPVYGAVLGMGIEQLSLYLLNSTSSFSRFFGHLINPITLLPIFEGKLRIYPTAFHGGTYGISIISLL